MEVFRNYEYIDPDDIESKRNEVKASYPNAVIIGDADPYYNCHHYAWHMRTGNSEKWWMNSEIGLNFDKNNLLYITDGSYTQVGKTSSKATHLVYFVNGLPIHSAVKTSIPNYVDSKWGRWFVVRHPVKDSPYNDSDIRYYKLTMEIDGQSPLFSKSFSISRTMMKVEPPLVAK